MKKEKKLTIRVSEELYQQIQSEANHDGMTVSEYIRLRVEEDISQDWIRKIKVQKVLSEIGTVLDKQETKSPRVVQMIRKEVKKLWKLL